MPLLRRTGAPGRGVMTYLHCPRCRLAIRRRVDFLTLENCPRCLARTAIAVPLFCSPLSAGELRRHDDVSPAPAGTGAGAGGAGSGTAAGAAT